MIAVILFQINILTLTFITFCIGRKRSCEGDGDVSLVQPGVQKVTTPATASSSTSAMKPQNNDFSVGVPPPHIPLADKSDERTLADIESIQSEKVIVKEKKSQPTSNISKPRAAPSPAKSPVSRGSAEGLKAGKKRSS